MKNGIVIVDHGSRREESNAMLEEVAALFATRFAQLYDIVEDCSPGPYLELFARHPRPGWHQWGDELLLEPKAEEPLELRAS